jgi:hypothetical protein
MSPSEYCAVPMAMPTVGGFELQMDEAPMVMMFGLPSLSMQLTSTTGQG